MNKFLNYKNLTLKFALSLGISVTCLSASYAQDKVRQIEMNQERGTPLLIEFKTGSYRFEQTATALQTHLNLRANADELRFKNETKSSFQGISNIRYQQYYKGIKVEHGSYVTTIKDGELVMMTGEYFANLNTTITPTLTETEAMNKALASVHASLYMWDIPAEENHLKAEENDVNATYKPKGELVICKDFTTQEMRLAYKFNVYAAKPISRAYIYVDAENGKILLSDAIIKHLDNNGNAATKYSGNRTIRTNDGSGDALKPHRLRTSTLGSLNNGKIETYNCQTTTSYAGAVDFKDNDNNWTSGEYNNAVWDNAALDGHWGAQVVYTYWQSQHARQSYDNANATIKSYIHYDVLYDNAFWDGTRMTYGDGSQTGFTALTALDVCAHEIGHAICSNTSNLTYQGESGAMNEAFSDIWGAAIEYYGEPTKKPWLIGEDISVQTPSLRSMENPKREQNPNTYGGQFWAPTTGTTQATDYGGVHTNSGVLNYWYYLLTAGGQGTNDVGNSFAVTGLGFVKSAAIAYATEKNLVSNSTYAQARTVSITQTGILYGTCSDEVVAVTNAWYAVNVGAAYTNACRNLDITITAVNNANTTYCAGSISPTIVVKNNGTTTITSATYTYNIDGGANTPFAWTGSIAAGAFATITMPTVSAIANGSHTYNVTSSLPNGGVDPVATNNSNSSSFTVSAGLNFNYAQNFETGAVSLNNFGLVTRAESFVQVYYQGANASTQGLILDGMSANGWVAPAAGAEFSSNPSHFAAANLCIDATTATSLQLKFDLKQLYSVANNNTNFRITVNGTQFGAIYQPSGANREWQTIILDLSAYIGGKVNIGFESNCQLSFSNASPNANYIDNISISKKIFTDAQVSNLNSQYCVAKITPSVTLTNLGANTLTSATINYTVNGGAVNTYAWTGSLTQGSSAIVSLPFVVSATGVYTLNVYTTVPNGTLDEITSNDAVSKAFSYNIVSLPYAQNFEGGVATIQDFSTQINAQSGTGVSAHAARSSNFGLYFEGNSAAGYPAAGSGPGLAGFDPTHPHYVKASFCFDASFATAATLNFDYFLQFGINNAYTNFRYRIDGATSFTSAIENPAGADKPWATKTVSLTPYLGGSGVITVTFEANCKYTRANTNSVFIDNVNVTYTTTQPLISFATATSSQVESSADGTTGCLGYKDVTVTMNIANAPTGAANVTITPAGTSTATTSGTPDYQILTPMPIVFANGVTTPKTFVVRVFDDNSVESAETVVLDFAISGTTNAVKTIGYHTLTIVDNDVDVMPVNTVTLFSENFEGVTEGEITNTTVGTNWAKADVTAGANKWVFGANGGITGSKAAYISDNVTTRTLTYTISGGGSTSRTRLITPKIVTTGYTNLQLSFNFKANGNDLGTTSVFDYGRLMYSLNGNTFTNLVATGSADATGTGNLTNDIPFYNKTTTTAYNVTLPVACENQPTLYIVWRWDNDNSTGTNPPFAIDDILLTSVSNIPVETVLASKQVSFGANAVVYVKDAANKLIARVKNNTTFDYGCTTFSIDRAGTSAVNLWSAAAADRAASKTILVAPTNDSPTGNYEITMYYDNAEYTGWQTATGKTWATNAKVIRSGGAIANITPATPFANGATNVIGTTANGTYLTGVTSTATFANYNLAGGFVVADLIPPTITSFTPTSGGVDAVVTITGTGFTSASAVMIGGVAASSFVVVNSTTITAVTNSGFSTGNIVVTTPCGTYNTNANTTPNVIFSRTSCVNTISITSVTPNVNTGFSGFDVVWNLGAGTYTAINVYYQPQTGAGSTFYTRKTFAGTATSGRLWTVNGTSQLYNIYIQGVCNGNSERVITTANTGLTGNSCSIIDLAATPLTVTNTDITFTWNTVQNAYLYQPIYQECDINGLRVAGGGQTGTAYLTPNAHPSTQSWTVSQLKPNTYYRFAVRVHCLQGNSDLISPYSLFPFIQTGASGVTCAAPLPSAGAGSTTNGYASQLITWAAVPSATNGYGINFRESTQASGTSYHLGNVTSYTISGLKQGSTYFYSVYGSCSNGQNPRSAEGSFVAGTGTFNCNAATPNTSVGVSTPPIGATLSWTTTPNSTQTGKLYGIIYSVVGSPNTTYVVFTDNVSQTLSQTAHQGIVANTNYNYTLQTYCDSRLQWVNNTGTFFVPLASGAERNSLETITPQGLEALAGLVDLEVYPNPANTEVTITSAVATSPADGSGSELVILDMLGREVYKTNNFGGNLTLNTKAFAAGTYLVKVNEGGNVMTKKLVVQ
jgi:bacillolysin